MLLCSNMGCIVAFYNHSIMLLGMRSKVGRAVWHAKYLPSPWGTMLKMRLSKTDFSSCMLGTALWLWSGLKLAFFSGVQKMSRIEGKMAFLDLRSGNCHPRNFYVFRWHACICFANWPILAETTVNAVPKRRGRKRIFFTEGPEIGHLRVGSKIVPKYVSLHCTSFPIHLQEDKEKLFDFSCLSPFWQQVPFYHFTIEFFLCNKYLSILSWFWSIVQCSCWLCLLFCVGASASDLPSSFPFFSWILSFFVFLLSGAYISLLVLVMFLFLLFIFLLLCVLLLITNVTYFFLSFLFFCVYLVWLFLLLWFLSLFLLFFILCFASLEKEKQWKQQNISFSLPLGELCANVLSQNHCLFFWWISFTEHVFV